MGMNESTLSNDGTPTGVHNARERAIYCRSFTPLDSEEDPCMLIEGDGCDLRTPDWNEDAHLWFPRDSAIAQFVQMLDSKREELFGRANRWGERLRDVPDPAEDPPPEPSQPPAAMEASWKRSQERDKKEEDTDVEGGGGQGPAAQPVEEDYYEDEEEEEGFECTVPLRLIGKKWVIVTIAEYQLYKCFMSMKMTGHVFFVTVAKYLEVHKTGPVDIGLFEDFVAERTGDRPNGVRAPHQPLFLDQIGRLQQVYLNTHRSTTDMYNTMSQICAAANRLCEDVSMGEAAALHGSKIEVSYDILKRLFDQCEHLKQLQKDTVQEE